jgi:hypothetical protein
MNKITGIKSIDFKIKAYGHGVVNWNGPTALADDNRKEINNHTLPKLRGFINLSGDKKDPSDPKSYSYKKKLNEINVKENPLYVSTNCVRNHLFKDTQFDGHFVTKENTPLLLSNLMGLVRGYVVPQSQCKRTSPLLLEDFVDILGNGNFEQMGRSGAKGGGVNADGVAVKDSSFFSKTTFGDTEYLAYGSISVEQLQFISLDQVFGRCSAIVNKAEAMLLADQITAFLISLAPDSGLSPKAVFHDKYVRFGTIFEMSEVGILLNDDAIKVVVDETLALLLDLSIRQAKGYLTVESMVIDYNDSNKMMRIKRDESSISTEPEAKFASYFFAK